MFFRSFGHLPFDYVLPARTALRSLPLGLRSTLPIIVDVDVSRAGTDF